MEAAEIETGVKMPVTKKLLPVTISAVPGVAQAQQSFVYANCQFFG
jgi:hypothetical protein